MNVKEQGKDYTSSYVFKTHNVDGVIKPIEFSTLEELDVYVEDLLNNKGYAKSDFIIVEVKDYTISSDLYEEQQEEEQEEQNNSEIV
jgi:hypothetical protein